MSARNVVLAVDSSSNSENAFDFYCDNLHQPGDLLIIIHSFELPTMPAVPYPYGYAYYEDWHRLIEDADQKAVKLLEKYGHTCQHRKINFKLFKEGGRAGEVICKLAKDENGNLIVMGTRGLGTIRRTFLGSVSNYVLHHAEIPVVVVPAKQKLTEPEAKKEC